MVDIWIYSLILFIKFFSSIFFFLVEQSPYPYVFHSVAFFLTRWNMNDNHWSTAAEINKKKRKKINKNIHEEWSVSPPFLKVYSVARFSFGRSFP